MKHIEKVPKFQLNILRAGSKKHFASTVSFEGIKINEQKFGSKQGVQHFNIGDTKTLLKLKEK